jgi:hypothetical protein
LADAHQTTARAILGLKFFMKYVTQPIEKNGFLRRALIVSGIHRRGMSLTMSTGLADGRSLP